MKYYLLKIAQSFIFPPGIFIVFLFLASLFVKRYRKFFLLLTLISYLFSTQFMGNLLLKPLEEPYNKPQIIDKDAKLVVVLGGGYYEGSSNLPLSQSAFKRAVYGYKLSKSLNLLLLYNGSGLESKSAKLTYSELFTDVKNIYYENRAINTKENASYTKKFLKKQHFEDAKIYLVTSAHHMKRAVKNFTKEGIKVIPSATDFLISKNFCYCFFFPSAEGTRLNYYALHEYLALFKENFE